MQTTDVLTAAAVIQPEPLTTCEAVTYLQDRLPRRPPDSWHRVLTALENGTATALAQVAASPLGLWLLRTVHIEGRRDPQPLIDSGRYLDPTAIENHLLEELIPAAIRSRLPLPRGEDPLRPKHRYDPKQVRQWLTTLATELRDAQARDWRWWQLAPHTFTKAQLGLRFGLGFGLVVGLLGAVGGGLAIGLGFALKVGLVFGLIGGLTIGLGFALVGGDRNTPAHADFRLRGRVTTLGSQLLRGLARGVLGGLVAGLVLGLIGLILGLWTGLTIGLVFWPATGLLFGLMLGLPFGVISFVVSPNIARRATSPAESLRGDRRLTVVATSMLSLAGLVGGLMFGLVTASEGPVGQLVFGLVVLGMLGSMLGLGLGSALIKTCWPPFILASLWLGGRRRLPFLLMRFLQDAYRLGLLRIVGPIYQFRHAALQDHLAPPTGSHEAREAANPSPQLGTR